MFFYLSAFGLLSCLLLGGSTKGGHLSDAVLQLLSIPVLLAALWRLLDARNLETRGTLAYCAALLAVPLMQLFPLPPAIWTHLPGRESVIAAFALLGQRLPWAPISLSPQSTWLSILSLLPPLAVYCSVLTLDWRERRLLSLLLIAAGVVSAFLGLAQLVQGQTSPLRFFAITNESSPVGFFANVNHFAALLYSTILLTAAWLTIGLATLRSAQDPGVVDSAPLAVSVVASVALVTLFAVELTTRSRGGIILTMVGLFGALTLSGAPVRFLKNRAVLFVLIGLTFALVFIGQSALFEALNRFAADPLTDSRTVFARTTFSAVKAFMPIGAGLGAFVPVFMLFEKPRDVEAYAGEYANHAHNDLLELLLETGVVGLLLLSLFLYWLARKASQAWGASNPGLLEIDKSLIRAAILIIAMLLCHSLIDYPLRTGAMMAIAAFACALMTKPALSPATAEAIDTRIVPWRLWRQPRTEPARVSTRRRRT